MTNVKNNPHLSHAGKPGMKWGYSYGTPNGKRKAAKMASRGIPYDIRKYENELSVVKSGSHGLYPNYTHYRYARGLRNNTSRYDNGIFGYHTTHYKGAVDRLINKLALGRELTGRVIRNGRKWVESLLE